MPMGKPVQLHESALGISPGQDPQQFEASCRRRFVAFVGLLLYVVPTRWRD